MPRVHPAAALTTIREMPRGALATGAVGAVGVLGATLAFLFATAWTLVPMALFLLAVVYGWVRHQDRTAKALSALATLSSVVILVLIMVYLFARSVPAFRHMGVLDMLTRTKQPMWRPPDDVFSLVPAMIGTVITTVIATFIAAPLGVAGALFISEIAPSWLREVVKPGVEMLAGIPSIVYGYLGYLVINAYMSDVLGLPTIGSLFAVGLVIGLMALPTVVSVAEDAVTSVPASVKDGSIAMGATEWQTMKSITVPASFSGISAAVLLGIGRAVGETMAATVMLGHIKEIPIPWYNVFANTETLTAMIASEYGNASGLHLSALFAAGVVLFVTVMALSVVSQFVEYRMKRQLRGEE
ncbi:MAG: phosphate ABC transporter permease subunit PstC [Halanaeroarchaeum sp.]